MVLILYLNDSGLGGAGVGLVVFAAAFLATRTVGSPTVDRYGGATAAIVVLVVEVAGFLLLATVHTLPAALTGAALVGVGVSLTFPATVALKTCRFGAVLRPGVRASKECCSIAEQQACSTRSACTVDEFGLAVKGRQPPTLPLVMRRVLAVVVLAALAAACTATAAPRSVRTTGGDQISFIGDGSRVTFTGLASRTKVTETVTSTDINGVCWRLKTKTESDAAGAVVVDDSTYAAMSPVTSAPKGAYYWGDAPQDFKVTVAGVQRTVRRQLLQHTITETTVTSHGLSGTLYDAHLPGRHPAVLLIRGSAGGEPGSLLPSVIAGYGYPVLALAYFKAPGLPATLQNVRLEYFRSAGVDGRSTGHRRQAPVHPRYVPRRRSGAAHRGHLPSPRVRRNRRRTKQQRRMRLPRLQSARVDTRRQAGALHPRVRRHPAE